MILLTYAALEIDEMVLIGIGILAVIALAFGLKPPSIEKIAEEAAKEEAKKLSQLSFDQLDELGKKEPSKKIVYKGKELIRDIRNTITGYTMSEDPHLLLTVEVGIKDSKESIFKSELFKKKKKTKAE